MEGGEERLLQRLVDSAVYKPFQLLRGPYACKLDKKGQVVGSSKFEPQEVFRKDELTCFAGYVREDYALPLPSIDEILQQHEALLEEDEQAILRLFAPQTARACQLGAGILPSTRATSAGIRGGKASWT